MIQRYTVDWWTSESVGEAGVMEKVDPSGEWVKWEDVGRELDIVYHMLQSDTDIILTHIVNLTGFAKEEDS